MICALSDSVHKNLASAICVTNEVIRKQCVSLSQISERRPLFRRLNQRSVGWENQKPARGRIWGGMKFRRRRSKGSRVPDWVPLYLQKWNENWKQTILIKWLIEIFFWSQKWMKFVIEGVQTEKGEKTTTEKLKKFLLTSGRMQIGKSQMKLLMGRGSRRKLKESFQCTPSPLRGRNSLPGKKTELTTGFPANLKNRFYKEGMLKRGDVKVEILF